MKQAVHRQNRWVDLMRDNLVYIVLVVLIIVFSLLNANFFQMENFIGIGRQTAMVSVIAVGMTFVITTGGIDLSVGSMLALSGVSAAFALEAGLGVAIATFLGLLTGFAQGMFNGVLVAYAKIPAFLTTLGTMSISRGLALTITNTKTVVIMDKTATAVWGSGEVFGIPVSILWTLLVLALGVFLYHYMPFGNYAKAIGGNMESARYSGIKVKRVLMWIYAISGTLCGLAGLMMNARMVGARPEIGLGMELDAIAAVILGGTAVSGGKGNIVKTVVGSVVMGIIVNGLIILGIPSNVQQIVKGLIIILAVALGK